MSPPTISPLRVGEVLEIIFAAFTPGITIHSDRELTVEIIAGDNAGFSDTVEYEAVVVRDGLVILSWQEHIGSTIVHVLEPAPTDRSRVTVPKIFHLNNPESRVELGK
jgi:hypothetical protein